MHYLGIALYAEGPTDYYFLRPLLQRLCEDICLRESPHSVEFSEVLALDHTEKVKNAPREARILQAAQAARSAWRILFVHTDGSNDPARAREQLVNPALALLERQLDGLGCGVALVPIRETETWAVWDGDALRQVFGSTLSDQDLGLAVNANLLESMWASVDQLTVEQKYGSSSKTNDDPAGVPVLRMGNIQDGDLDFSNLKYLPINHDEFPGLHLQDGDLLFNRTNSPELVGKTAVYRSQISPCSFASYLISVRFSGGYIPELASAFINSAYGKRWIKSVVVQQVGQANVNGSKLSALAVPVPPFEEEQEIVSALNTQTSEIVDQLKSVEMSLKQSNAQRQNILRAAFAGQLVPQDPHDEPASVLLERIRAERAARDAVKKPRGRKVTEAA